MNKKQLSAIKRLAQRKGLLVGISILLLASFYAITIGQTKITIDTPRVKSPAVSVETLQSTSPKPQKEPSSVESPKQVPVNADGTKEKELHASEILKKKEYSQYRYEALATVNDPQVSSSWYHTTIQSGRAWDVSAGSTSTIIAVIDSGFALAHEDLTGIWYTNAREQGMTAPGGICYESAPADKSTNNCDDDQNGYVDDWRGWDFSTGDGDNDPQTGVVNPSGNGVQHGTLVSGLIAATANNGLGNAGIDQRAKIMPLQALSDNGDGYTYDIVSAIEYAVINGAKIINMSLGGNQFDQAFQDAVIYAKEQGVLIVVASGNCGDSSADICSGLTAPGRETYPAKFSQVLSVGATTSGDIRSSFSSYGPELDIVAPGSLVGPLASWSSAYPTNGYVTSASGTSLSSPIVAGVAGLVRAQLSAPTVDQIRSILTGSADKIDDLSNVARSDVYGYGRVNAHKATLLAKAIVTPPGNVGTSAIGARQPARGGVTRSITGNVISDEWSVIVCRVEVSDSCSAVITNGANTLRFIPVDQSKGASLYYMFVKGTSLSSGTSILSVHNRNYATRIQDLTR